MNLLLSPTFRNNLSEKNNLLPHHLFTLSAIQALTKGSYFELHNIEHLRTLKSTNHWLIIDILQIHHFQYQFFQNRTLKTQTEEQIRIYSLFLRKFLDIATKSFRITNSKTLVLTFLLNFLQMISFLLLLALKIKTLPSMTSVIFPSLILNSSLMTLILSTKVLNFLLLSDLIKNISLDRLHQIPLLTSHSKLSLLLPMC